MDWCLLVDKPLEPSQIEISLLAAFNCKSCDLVDQTMDSQWTDACQTNPTLFNATKFRLDSVSELDNKNLQVNIGVTDYKETLCTNMSELRARISDAGERLHRDRFSCFGNAIGVGSTVVTTDGYLVFIKRAQWVAEAKGLLDSPGGHAEPLELLTRTRKKIVFDATSEEVVYEIFNSMIREVRDEINVPEESISWPQFLGIFRNMKLGGKPGFLFNINCSLRKKEIEELYNKGGAETDESTQIIFAHKKCDLEPLKMKMSPGGQAAVYLYQKYFS